MIGLLIAFVEKHKPSSMKSSTQKTPLLFRISATFLTSQHPQLSIKDTMKNINTKFIFSALCISALSTGLLGMEHNTAYESNRGEQINKDLDELRMNLIKNGHITYIPHNGKSSLQPCPITIELHAAEQAWLHFYDATQVRKVPVDTAAREVRAFINDTYARNIQKSAIQTLLNIFATPPSKN
jgi:hypothetical protein